MVVLVVLLAGGAAALVYLGWERLGSRAWLPLVCRTIAWAALGLLLVDLSCAVRATPARPFVLLDASLSLSAAGGRWQEARDSAVRMGEVRRFGDERLTSDTTPTRGRSLLAPALVAASSSDRPIIVVSDGEIEDQLDIPPDILARATVRLFPRTPPPDVAITRVAGPLRVSAGDSIPLELAVEKTGGSTRDTITVTVESDARRLASGLVRLAGADAGRARIVIPPGALAKGDHLLHVNLVGAGDREPRTDNRLHLVTVTPTPGVVFLAAPADWDSRFLYRVLREVTQLPVRGFVRLDAERWRDMTSLRTVSAEQVRGAARAADLLILKGGIARLAESSLARGVWLWPSGENGEPQIPGDWYLSAGDGSPVASAFLGQPLDSFPPVTQLTPIDPGPREWVGLYAQLGRRGLRRPAVLGGQSGRVRQIRVAVDGLWRWAFRGGSSEQSYRSWVAATASWLLGGVDTAGGVARAVQPVVANGRPLLFEWVGSGAPVPQGIMWSGAGGPGGRGNGVVERDTLRFDGNGRATVWLAPGEYRYRLSGGGAGTVAVEEYSDELLPRPVTLSPHTGRAPRSTARTSARDWIWLFGICILALSGEWLARRRLGLR
jgi:hypothetical protein